MNRSNSTNRSLVKFDESVKNLKTEGGEISHYFGIRSKSISKSNLKTPKDPKAFNGIGLYTKNDQ